MVKLRGQTNQRRTTSSTKKSIHHQTNGASKQINGDDECIIINDSDVETSVASSSSFLTDSSTTDLRRVVRDTENTEIYRKGDWIYIEEDENRPYEIRKILDLTKTADGSIEAKLGCVYRRSDISPSLLASFESEYADYYDYLKKSSPSSSHHLDQLLKRLEVFYSNCIETEVPVECFRGKTHVRLLMMNIDTLSDLIGISEPSNASNRLLRRQSQSRLNSNSNTNLNDITTDKYFYLGIYNPNAKTLQCAHKACDEALVSSDEWPNDEIIGVKKNIKRSKIRKKIGTATTSKGISRRSESPLRETRVKIRESKSSPKSDRKSVLIKWLANDKKKFEAGFNEFQRNFNEIQKKHLPNKTVSDVVEYYYVVWKTNEEQKKRIAEKQKLRVSVEYTGPKFTLVNQSPPSALRENQNNQCSNSMRCISCDECKSLSCFNHSRPKTSTKRQQQQQQTSTKVKQMKSGALIATDESSANQHHVTHQAFPLTPVSKTALKKFENVCNSCLLFWKKHGIFVNGVDPNMPVQTAPIQREDPDNRRGRIEALRYQLFKCNDDKCQMEFATRAKFQRHLRYAHSADNVHKFVFRPSFPLQLALSHRSNRTLTRRLAKRPFDTSGILTYGYLLKSKPTDSQNHVVNKRQQRSPIQRKRTVSVNNSGTISTRLQRENREAQRQTAIDNLEKVISRLRARSERSVCESSSSTSMSLRSRSSPHRKTRPTRNDNEEKENLSLSEEDDENEPPTRVDLNLCDTIIANTPSPSASSRSPSQADCSPTPSVVVLNTPISQEHTNNALHPQVSSNRSLLNTSSSSSSSSSPTKSAKRLNLTTTPTSIHKAKPRYRPSVIPIMSLRDKYQLTTTRSSNYMKPSIIRNSFPKAKNGY